LADRAAHRARIHVDQFVVAAALREALRGTPAKAVVPAVAPLAGLVGALECGHYDQAAQVLLPLLPKGSLERLPPRPSSAAFPAAAAHDLLRLFRTGSFRSGEVIETMRRFTMRRVAPSAALLVALGLAAGSAPAQQTIFQKRRATFQAPTAPFQTPTSIYHGSYLWGRTPWFYNENVRRELNLTNNQYNQLRQNYDQLYGRVGTNLTAVEGMTPAEQVQWYQNWTNTMSTDFGKTAADVLNAQQMNRWRQLELQYRGYGAFVDPTVRQRLNLIDPQIQQLQTLGQKYGADLADIYKSGATDSAAALRQYEALRQAYTESLNNVLTPAQMRAWGEMTGQPSVSPPTFAVPAPASGGIVPPF
jgi:hypothetical protein